MDAREATKLAAELKGKTIAGWTIGDLINNGKSAVVLHAKRGADAAALKVFDRDLVERFGKDVQRQRVERERQLVGQEHKHLVRVLDAGEDTALGVFFVAMEYLQWSNLADCLERIPRDRIHPLLGQVASAAKYLESIGLVHRDIKPPNIVVSPDFGRAVLLDLGVIGPIGKIGAITDHGDQKVFLGTLQYSAPEYLFRNEEDSVDGWRAVTFYQLGGVLHDLIVRKPLFADFQDPFANLVRAVEREKPRVEAVDVPRDLLQLCRNCLVKDPAERRSLVTWESLEREPAPDGDQDAALRRIRERRIAATARANKAVGARAPGVEPFRRFIDEEIRRIAQKNELPPRSVEVALENDVVLARVTFLASADDGLAVSAVVYIESSLPSAPDDVVRVRASTKLVRAWEQTAGDRPPEVRFKEVFAGVRDDRTISSAIEHQLIATVDAAGEASADSIPAADNEKWLAVPEVAHA